MWPRGSSIPTTIVEPIHLLLPGAGLLHTLAAGDIATSHIVFSRGPAFLLPFPKPLVEVGMVEVKDGIAGG